MIDRAMFDVESFEMHISSRSSATSISLCLSEPEHANTSPNCISGFPRTLMTEDELRGKSLSPTTFRTRLNFLR